MHVTIGWARPSSTGRGIELLDARERARADTFVRAEDRHRYIAQHALLRQVVGELTDVDPGGLDLGSHCSVCGGNDHGRPVLRTDASVQVSASRSGQRVVVAVARGGEPIGIDVEPTMTAWSGEAAFDRTAFAPSERTTLMTQPEPDRPRTRTLMWVRKEAVLKRAGIGLTTSPADFDATASGDVLTDVDVGANYRCVLATAEPVRITVVNATARLTGWAAQS